MGTLNETTMRAVFTILALAVCLSFASDVEDLGVQPINNKASLGEATKTRDEEEGHFGGALMTSGSFTMMAASAGFGEEERDELGEANDWDITNGGQQVLRAVLPPGQVRGRVCRWRRVHKDLPRPRRCRRTVQCDQDGYAARVDQRPGRGKDNVSDEVQGDAGWSQGQRPR